MTTTKCRKSKKKKRIIPPPSRRGKPGQSALRDPQIYDAIRSWRGEEPPVTYRKLSELVETNFNIRRSPGTINRFVKGCEKKHMSPKKVFILPPLPSLPGKSKPVGAIPVMAPVSKSTTTKSAIPVSKKTFKYDGE